MTIRSTGIRPIERNGLRGFGLTITIDNTNSQACPSEPADKATGADSSSPAPVASYDPWTVKNGRRV